MTQPTLCGTHTSRTAVAQPLSEGPTHIPEGVPGWFLDARRDAWKTFDELPMPSRTDEEWRFSDLSRLDLSSFRVSGAVSDTARRISASTGVPGAVARMVFVNDRLAAAPKLPAELAAQGVLFLPLDEALRSHPDLVAQYLFKQDARLGGAKFAALHRAFVRTGTFLHVPKGVKIDGALEVFHWLSGEHASVFPHTVLAAEAGSRVTLVDHYRSADAAESGFACGMNDLHVAADARADYVCVQEWSPAVLAMQFNTTEVHNAGAVTGLNVNLGAATARVESRSVLRGEGSRSDMLAVSVGDANQIFDLRTLQDHAVRGSTSDLLYKNALAGSARAIFSGLIRVEPGAHQTDAYQTNRTLLLSETAESNSMPGLEILADDVKCSHGSTTSDVSPEEMFYLQARGIHPETARTLLVLGFLQEVFTRLGNPNLEGFLRERVQAKFDRINA